MGLTVMTGSRKAVDHALISYALTHTPSIIIDCSNVANIHKWFPLFPDADYDNVFVYEFELLHKFRDALIRVKKAQHPVKAIVVTSMHHLFHYQNEGENHEVYLHAWELLDELARTYDVRVAIDRMPKQFAHVVQEDVMGHTVWSQRQNLEHMVAELERYARSLRKEERELASDLLRAPFSHVGSISSANSLHAWSFLLFSIMLEQEKRLRLLESHAGLAYRRIPNEQQHRLVVKS